MHRMRCLRWPIVLVMVAVGMTFGSAVLADDFQPPPNIIANWNRGDAFTATYEWDFDSDPAGGPLAPDGAIVPTPADGGGGGPLAIPGPNVVDGGGSWVGGPSAPNSQIQFLLPNWIDDQAYKDVWAQITFDDAGNGSPSLDFDSAFDPTGAVSANFILATEDDTDRHRTEWWRLVPNPNWEIFVLNVPEGTAIDQVIFDTISRGGNIIPEPSTYALFGLGAIVLIGWRRRRKVA